MHKFMQEILRLVVTLVCATASVSSIAADASTKSAARKQIERGQYLVMITGCHDCHTPNFLLNGGKTPEKEFLVGGSLGWRGPWGTTYPANLRLYFQEITEEQWIKVAKEIQRRPPMPYYSLNAMSEPDVRAIYSYIRSLGPVGVPAPKFVAMDKEPSKPFVQFPMN